VAVDVARTLDIALEKRGKSTSVEDSVPRTSTGLGLSKMDFSQYGANFVFS